MEWTGEEQARIDVSDRLRLGLHRLVGSDHDEATLRAVVKALDEALEPLANAPRRTRELGKWADPDGIEAPADGEAFNNSIDRPVSGPGNPWSIPLHVIRRDDRAVTTVNLGPGYEGAPDRAHGGVVSAIFDDLCGFLLTLDLVIAFTASLTINYHAGTPLNSPLTYSAWIEKREGRKMYMRGECRVGDEDPEGELVTSCTALFISIDAFPESG